MFVGWNRYNCGFVCVINGCCNFDLGVVVEFKIVSVFGLVVVGGIEDGLIE